MTHGFRSIPALALTGLFALALAPTPAAGQSAEEVIDRAAEAYEEQMEGVRNFTVVQHQEGREGEKQVTYFTRTEGDDGPMFRVETVGRGGPEDASNPYDLFHLFRDRGELVGTESVNGHETYVVRAEGVAPDELPSFGGPSGGSAAQTLVYHLDTEDLLIRRMVVESEGGSGIPGQEGEATTIQLDFLDYREVDGMMFAHRMEMNLDSPMMEAMAGQMQQLQESMADIPEEQREQMRAMMEGRMAGGMTGAIVVDELRVNEGPPEGLGGEG